MKFETLDLDPRLLEAISYMGYTETTPIQELAIPKILAGHDLLASAQTGTGKTAAFIIPILQKLAENPTPKTDTLVLVPTRELAIQIEQHIQGLAYFVDVQSQAMYGGDDGSNWVFQKRALTEGCNIIVATPGKLISHLNLGYADFSTLKHLVLDEADRMLDIGFYDDILKIISYLPEDRQTLMFSATMPPRIRELASKIMKDPEEISLAVSKPATGVMQAAYYVNEKQKTPLLRHLVQDKPSLKSVLVFTSTKKKVREITAALQGQDYTVRGISSDLEQQEREEVLKKFHARQVQILVATDVLSRGIDVKDINLVVNYDVPGDAEDYVHRVGRTARADSTGVALTFISPADRHKFRKIEQLIERKIPKLALPPRIEQLQAENPKSADPSRGRGGRTRNQKRKTGNNRPRRR